MRGRGGELWAAAFMGWRHRALVLLRYTQATRG